MTRFSKEDRNKLAGLHKALKECLAGFDALDYKDVDEGADKATKKAKAFGYGEAPVKKAASTVTPTLNETLAKIGTASTLKKVK
jgi:hypothetical protein